VTHQPTPQEHRVLSREISVFLVQFSIALHNISTYPPGHPMLESAVDAVMGRLLPLLAQNPRLSLGVAKMQLLVEGAATDPDNAVLRDLAQRLHRHQIGALQYSEGVAHDEMADLLERLSADPVYQGEPLGLSTESNLRQWPHIRITPLAFDQLELVDQRPGDSDQSRAVRLWLALADTAILRDEPSEEKRSLDASDVASSINESHRDESYDRVIVGYLLQLSRELSQSEGTDGAVLKRRLTELLDGLTPETLRRLLEIGGGLAERQELVKTLSGSIPVNAVMELIRASASASQQTVSHSLLRILTKLADHAQSPNATVRFDADVAFRDSVQDLVDSWVLKDPNPEAYTEVLERLARPDTALKPDAEIEFESEAARVVKMSLELDLFGASAGDAVDHMVANGSLPTLFMLLEEDAGKSETGNRFWSHLCRAETVERLLSEESPDFESTSQVLERMGMDAAKPLLDALEKAESLGTRRWLLTRLSDLGPELGPLLVERLTDTPWFVQRNMLVLLGAIGAWPKGFSPVAHTRHEDSRVRRAALKLMLGRPELRDAALGEAVGDPADAVVRMGLGSAAESCPPSALPKIMSLLQDQTRDPELRVLAIRALGTVSTSTTRDWLTNHALARKRWFRRRRLAAKSPELLAILPILAERWVTHPDAAAVVRLATKSSDPEIRAAVGAGRGEAT
jgi:hypothetical protein